MKKLAALVAIGAASALTLTACSSGDSSADGGDVTLQYWMWDDQQAPLYQACAAAFTEANPEITVEITQTGWAQYWQNLNTQITAGTAPDIFVNQISYYKEFVDNQQLLDLSEYVDASDIDFADFTPDLAERWVEGDARYGLPKDWDTVGVLYNVKAAEEAGFTAEDMASLTWNPTDGGTFGEFVRATSIDSAGRDGRDPAFDSDDVVRYGYYPEWADGAIGQNGWGVFAHANGFTFGDGTSAPDYSDESLVETATWLQSLIEDGYAPSFDSTSTLGTQAVMENENAASTIQGSWMASSYLGEAAPVDFAFAAVPTGPEGRFASTNGLADSVWAGTSHPDVGRVPGHRRRGRPDLPGAHLGHPGRPRGPRGHGLRLDGLRVRRGRRRHLPGPGHRALGRGQHRGPGRHAVDRAGHRRPDRARHCSRHGRVLLRVTPRPVSDDSAADRALAGHLPDPDRARTGCSPDRPAAGRPLTTSTTTRQQGEPRLAGHHDGGNGAPHRSRRRAEETSCRSTARPASP
jgi:multiple sugar transport system substrate-binding protein